MSVWRLICGFIEVAHVLESKCGIHHDLLKVESHGNSLKNSTCQKTCPFELSLLALFRGVSKMSFFVISVVQNLFFRFEILHFGFVSLSNERKAGER
jgi:hypothetical protein